MKTAHRIIATEPENNAVSKIAARHIDLTASLSHLRDEQLMRRLSSRAIRAGRTPSEMESLCAAVADEWIFTALEV